MLKSHVQELRGLIECLLKDTSSAYPHLGRAVKVDLHHLMRTVDARGIGTIATDLPRLGKALDRALSEGQLDCSKLVLSKRATPRTVLPRFLFGLWILIFDDSGRLREDYDVEAVLFLRQLLYVGKRAHIACSEEDTDREVDVFFELDGSLPCPEQFWEHGGGEVGQVYQGFYTSAKVLKRLSTSPLKGRPEILRYLDRVYGILISSLGEFSPYDWDRKHGPGAVAEVTGKKDKFLFDYWSPTLERIFPMCDFAFHNAGAWATNGQSLGITERSSRLIAVPKTLTKPRLIAAEPSENMWCQQIVWNYLRSMTEKGIIGRFIAFRDQTRNQEMVKKGSVGGDLCTIDLSAASDRVTCHVVGQAFRCNPPLLRAFQAVRTRRIVYPKRTIIHQTGDAALVSYMTAPLRKFSTMGSACTFPVESILFLGIAIAATLWKRGLQVTPGTISQLESEVSVFGDDIIVPKDSWRVTQDLLEVLYFKVNTDKSYGVGNFRESCGVDAMDGVDVTPTYWSAPLNAKSAQSVAGFTAMRNHFYKKWFMHTAEYLTRQLPVPFRVPVASDVDLQGITSFVRPTRLAYKTRWNKALQRMEAQIYSAKSKLSVVPANGDAAFLRFFTTKAAPFKARGLDTPMDVTVSHSHEWVDLSDLHLK